MPFPLIKLFSLFIKQASKPMARAIKVKAKEHPSFRKICIAPANWYHMWDVNVKMRLLGMGKTKTTHKMDEESAVELGADMIGEGFLYLFASVVLLAEYTYLSRNSEKREADKQQRIEGLENRVETLGAEVETLSNHIQKMEDLVRQLEDKNKGLLERLQISSGRRS